MSMFGDLTDFSLIELLPLLGRRCGVLTLENNARGTCHIFLAGEAITHLEVIAPQAPNTETGLHYLCNLFQAPPTGYFTFRSLDPEQLPRTVDWPLGWLLLMVSRYAQLPIREDALPDPETVFVMSFKMTENLTRLTPDLRQRLLLLDSVMDGRRSVRAIGHLLDLPERELLVMIAHLNLLGYVYTKHRFTWSGSMLPALPRLKHTFGSSFFQRLTGLLQARAV